MLLGLPPALLIHGAGGGAWEWQIWQRVFAAQRIATHVLTLAPFPGDSAENDFAETNYAHYLQQVAQALRVSKAQVMIGASLGGLLAAEVAAQQNIGALVLLAPVPKVGMPGAHPTQPKRWASSADLANTIRALPDADAASALLAHQRWRDESQYVLAPAYRGRAFDDFPGHALMLLAQNECTISNGILRDWAGAAQMDVLQMAGASHAGLLLGRQAARAAESTIQWLRSRLC